MTDPKGSLARRRGRSTTLRALIASMEDRIAAELARLDPLDAEAGAFVLEKMDDLQRAHLRLLSLEESLDGTEQDGNDSDPIDLDAMRDTIGRRLDRLRATQGSGPVPKGPDGT